MRCRTVVWSWTLAALAQSATFYRFYEINSDVYKLSSGKHPSSLLADSPAMELSLGDARLSLEREAAIGSPEF